MARYYTPTTKEEFLKKIEKLMSTDTDDDGFPYNLPMKIQKDFKVSFDWENYFGFDDEPREGNLEGYREISPGFHIFFAWAGGDWEYPVTWVFYNSDKGIRAYIPSDGNPWNKKEKCALGNSDGDDMDVSIDEKKK